MKNLITTIASVVILMVFLLQFVNNQQLHKRVMSVDREIWCAKEIMKQEGCLSEIRKNELAKKLSSIADCSNDEIEIKGTAEIKNRGEIIELHLRVPIKDLIAANEFLGISNEDNKKYYESDLFTTSEYLERGN